MAPFRRPEIGKPLPNADQAVIPPAKLVEYALDPENSDGKDRVFQAALGIGKEDWEYLSDSVLDLLPSSPVSSRGERYTVTWRVVIDVLGLNGRVAPVLTSWQMVEGVPRLVTIYVL
jgi:uncharacterized protein DUF6883